MAVTIEWKLQDERRERLKRLLADKTEEEQENILGRAAPAMRRIAGFQNVNTLVSRAVWHVTL